MFNVDLDITKLGFSSMTSFLVNCQSVECTTDGDKYVIFPMKWGKKYDEPEESTSDPFLSVDTVSTIYLGILSLWFFTLSSTESYK